MKFYSTRDRSNQASFEEAVFNSLPKDNGLYFPEKIPEFSKSWFSDFATKSKTEIGFDVASLFVGEEIDSESLRKIVEETVDFEIPLVPVVPNIHALELFHGPTWAFKDVGARFLSRCMGYFTKKSGREVTILVATSGDTGSAVAAGFHRVPGVQVKVLFPKGKVSIIQQLQLTTWGDNIEAFEVDGTFDDCQRMVKGAFLDKELNSRFNLSSANSINIARLIPQSFYYFYALQQLESTGNVVMCVPSGNYGNITAGLFAWKMGLPVNRFIAANNLNHVVPDYLVSGEYQPRPSIQTYANAMDVGDPSNFVRMLELFQGSHAQLAKLIRGFYMDDQKILEVIHDCKSSHNYLLDPHGAIGYQALRELLKPGEQGIFLETAHPVKFLPVVEKVISGLDFGKMTREFESKDSKFESISSDFAGFRDRLLV